MKNRANDFQTTNDGPRIPELHATAPMVSQLLQSLQLAGAVFPENFKHMLSMLESLSP
jgi:hypothetical protein